MRDFLPERFGLLLLSESVVRNGHGLEEGGGGQNPSIIK